MSQDSNTILTTWLNGINGGQYESVLALYHPEAVLLPTFSSHTLTSPDQIRDYFTQLATRENLSIDLHESTVREQLLGADAACVSGIYTWHFDIDSESMTFEARFTYVLRLDESSPIVQHHSSQIPRMIS